MTFFFAETSTASNQSTSPKKTSWTVNEGENLQNQIDQLKMSLKHMNMEYFKLQNETARKNIINLSPVSSSEVSR